MRKRILFLPSLALVLASCDFIQIRDDTGSNNDLNTSNLNSNSDVSNNSSTKPGSTSPSTSSPSTSSSQPSSTTPISTSQTPSTPTTKPEEITVFSINDLHGCLEENATNKELGVAKLDYAIKHDVDYDPNTSIIISTGDTWEGGYIAHEEKTLTDQLLDEVGVQAMVLGNHDFSWGTDVIKQLKSVSPYPYIAANIKNGSSHSNDLSNNNIIINKGGAKVGIIGLASAESSITKDDLNGYSFDTSMDVISNQITYLNNQNCDLVLVAVHDSLDKDSNYNYITDSGYVVDIGNTFNTSQIQGIFGAHTHSFDDVYVGSNNLPLVQGGCNSKGYSKMTFKISDKSLVSKSCVGKSNAFYNKYNSTPESSLNQTIVNKLKTASTQYGAKEQCCKFDYQFSKTNELYSFVPHCMIQEAKRLGWASSNEFIGIHNTAGIRANIAAGTATKEDLFKVEPFDNQVKVIPNVPGSKIAKVIGTVKNSHLAQYDAYLRESKDSFDSSLTYTVVTIDYVSSSSYWTRNIPVSSYPVYNLDRSNGQSQSNAKVKMILNAMLDFIRSEKPSSGLKTYKKADFTV